MSEEVSSYSGVVIDEEDYLNHYGILRRSGRYPWGSGGNAEQNHRSFLGMVEDLRKKGLSETEIAASFDIKTTDLRALRSTAKNAVRAADIAMAERLKAKGMSNKAIAERMGLAGESSVRSLLAPGVKERTDVLQTTADFLRQQVDEKGVIDVGVGVEHFVGLSRTRLDTVLSILKNEGYEVINVQEDNLSAPGNKTLIKTLAKPGTTYKDINMDRSQIQSIDGILKDGIVEKVRPPEMLDSKRIQIAYKEDGGADADGVIYIRPGAEGLDIGGSQYAQVRIAVDGTHYLKGMAVYKSDLPDGVDVVFNTNKSRESAGPDKHAVMKEMNMTPDGKLDVDNPFGSAIKPGGQRGVLNIVNEEGDWDDWSRSLASQMLSKQSRSLAKQQLDKVYAKKKAELDEINALTNPAVKKQLLESYADGVDSSAVHLKAAAMDRQRTQVILPINSLKDTEIYAPNFRDGERVALVRFPHGGTFEIPELVVNNSNPEGKRIVTPAAKDAVGINSKVAERLSGADFDGDVVLVIPNNRGLVKSTPPLEGLKNFDPKASYPPYDGMPTMGGGKWDAAKGRPVYPPKPDGREGGPSPKAKGREMGNVSNLITDMTIRGATTDEIARAVRHSMVVIDAEKHSLNYKLSAEVNGIAQLKEKYQGRNESGQLKGASTLISRTTSEQRVPHRRRHFKIDPDTGEKIWDYTGETITTRKTNRRGEVVETVKPKMIKSTKGAEAKDAHTLSSGTPIESIYANHANRLKALGNAARKSMVNTKDTTYSPSAAKIYAKEVSTLTSKLNVALKNAPVERKAQIVANAVVRQKRQSNPDMDRDDLKKLESRELTRARTRLGAKKTLVDITASEWEAIQAGAISTSRLSKILRNADLDKVKTLATPRQPRVMTASKQARAKALLSSGRTPSEVADILGVALSTLKSSIES